MHHLSMFDLHLAIYRSLKSSTETKVDFDMPLGPLREYGLLKNHKFPFFLFDDNRNNGNLITTYEDKLAILKTISQNDFELYTIYQTYLPRVNTFNNLNAHPELETYYQTRKKGLNKLSPYYFNPLISEKNSLEWFIYDDESLNFLATLEKKYFDITSKIKNSSDNQIYFEDKFPTSTLKEKDLDKFFINVTFVAKTANNGNDLITKKLKIKTTTTALDVLTIMTKKISLMQAELAFDPKSKILKVKSMNDYIIEITEPLIKFAYINQCVTRNEPAEYIIIDNPFSGNELIAENNFLNGLDVSAIEGDVNTSRRRGQTVFMAEHQIASVNNNNNNDEDIVLENEKIKKLLNIASFRPDEDKKFVGSKKTNFDSDSDNKDELELFMKSCIEELNESMKKTIDECHKLITDPNGTMILDDDGWNLSVINQSTMSITPHPTQHPIPRMSTINTFDPRQTKNQNLNINARPSILSVTNFSVKKKKHKEVIQTPNMFVEGMKETADVISMLEMQHDSIMLNEVARPFSITFRDAILNNQFNSFPFEKKRYISVITFNFQIFCGGSPFSRQKTIKWISKQVDYHPSFNKRIYFDLNYNSLPVFASLLITVKHNIYEKNNTVVSSDTIGWANFKLFDHNKRLMTGIHKISLLETEFCDDSYFCYIDNINDHKASNVFFEIESFSNPVANEIINVDDFNFNIDKLMISDTDQEKIKDIRTKGPFDELNNYDKEVLWTNRYKLSQEPSILSKLLLCIDYRQPSHLIELEKILAVAKPLTPIQSMELLTGTYLHESIRKFAVKCLSVSTPQEIQSYLIQLVQGLKYEMYHDNELARYLLKMAINYPLTIGHSLFWSLRSEMYNPIVQQRFGIYLEVFLDKIGEKLTEIFYEESAFVAKLLQIAEIPKQKEKKKEVIKREFKEALSTYNKTLVESQKQVSLPLNFKYRIKGFKVDECKYMKSKKKPLWLVLVNADPNGEDIIVLFKSGDDLRMDIVTLQLFKIMQALWFNNNLKLKMSLYTVISTGYYQGMIEIVKNSATLAEIHKEEGGALQSFTKSSLKKWLEHNGLLPEEELVHNFFLTNVAYCCATFVLGVGDRHSDNIMVKRNGELFHIDFGHFLGHFKYKMGIKRERAPFVFTKQFQNVLGGEKSQTYAEFKEYFWKAYKLLRDNVMVLVTLLRILLTTGIPELTEKSIRFIDSSLCLNKNDELAKKFLYSKLDESLGAWSVELNFWIHILANK